ncbi:EamA family transporter [Terriglobus sp.]|uniref:EamA family transporter n=1 Tax=Terriglobus sp. TaxID=1889013 RepID=UPI003AFF9C3E
MPEPAQQSKEEAGTSVPASSFAAVTGAASHRLAPGQYLILVFIMLGASVGDALLSKGMRQVGFVSPAHPALLLHALLNPWVACGIAVLISFMGSYMTALSWADLTFVQPATAFGNVVTALIGRFWLHEIISPMRWLGIALIVVGVGFVANGPSKTEHSLLTVSHQDQT